jgi:hypothetical protein
VRCRIGAALDEGDVDLRCRLAQQGQVLRRTGGRRSRTSTPFSFRICA